MKRTSILLLIVSLLLTGCAPAAGSAQTDTPQTGAQQVELKESETKQPVALTTSKLESAKKWDDISSEDPVIFLAGGCFWGMQKYLQTIPGVKRTVVGYANGKWEREYPLTYDAVKTGKTGFRETVYVEYDPEEVSLDTILFAYFYVIDPTVANRQGPDVGSEYQTGIYYTNEAAREAVERIAAIERERYAPYGDFMVEIEPLEVFYEAEAEHQKYLEKNPAGYCHIQPGQIEWMKQIVVDAAPYARTDTSDLRDRLTPTQYQVTQENYTEEPFNNEYWNTFEKGIYVDIVSGEPLFSSLDKYESSCGWPAFSKGIDVNTFFFIGDYQLDTPRVEVRSRAADSHLGHIFEADAESPTGTRYCINSASIRFVPYEEMEAQGYGYLMFLFDEETTDYPKVSVQEAKALMDEGAVIVLDVREAYEYQEGHISGAVSLPVGTMGPGMGEIIGAEPDSVILVCSGSEERSRTAAEYLARDGYTNVYLFSDLADWPHGLTAE